MERKTEKIRLTRHIVGLVIDILQGLAFFIIVLSLIAAIIEFDKNPNELGEKLGTFSKAFTNAYTTK